MTDQKPPTLAAAFADIGNAIGAGLKRIGLAVAEAAEAVQDDYALVPDPDEAEPQSIIVGGQGGDGDVLDFRARGRARMALMACLDQDDDHTARLLDRLDPEQLRAVEHAAVALFLHASRLRPHDDRAADQQPVTGRHALTGRAAAIRAERDAFGERLMQTEALDDAQANAVADLRTIIDEQPDTFRAFLRDEIRRDPEWWRDILRRELRAGFLREDFDRAGVTVRDGTSDTDAWRP
ncbi:hypothetical protein E1287_37725 [Actinomadura sp. KC06]|uniref:hypothetical protein n=1 Tax=Actinomadura sp. KC06 TaxID=2530369 RepID=UPI0010523037|nr:hypothetical protein [Actinomadura sp. KC06]TDD25003.1 hypothetical protein E1287_37725 [Actinomadura sp. KC06]